MTGNSTLWKYSGNKVGSLYIWQSNAIVTTTLSGIEFVVTRKTSAIGSEVESTLSFIADLAMNEQTISCTGDGETNNVVFHVITDGKN